MGIKLSHYHAHVDMRGRRYMDIAHQGKMIWHSSSFFLPLPPMPMHTRYIDDIMFMMPMLITPTDLHHAPRGACHLGSMPTIPPSSFTIESTFCTCTLPTFPYLFPLSFVIFLGEIMWTVFFEFLLLFKKNLRQEFWETVEQKPHNHHNSRFYWI